MPGLLGSCSPARLGFAGLPLPNCHFLIVRNVMGGIDPENCEAHLPAFRHLIAGLAAVTREASCVIG